jgi:hypothetical protein
MTAKTLVFAHGASLKKFNWEPVVYGVDGLLGRATYALYRAHKIPGSTLALGSGATEKEYNGKILKEAEYTLAFLRDNFDRLGQFPELCGLWRMERNRLRRKLETVHLELQARNTVEEADNIVAYAYESGYKNLLVISDKGHAWRCHLHATQAAEAQGIVGKINIDAGFSPAPNDRQKAADCVAFEPPTDGTNMVGNLAKRLHKFPPGISPEDKAATIEATHAFFDERGLGR